MNKLLLLLFIPILLVGCIEIEDAIQSEELVESINFTFDDEVKETEDPGFREIGRPDLVIANIYWSTLFPDVNQSDELNIKVKNIGNESVDGFNYKITLFKEYEKWKESTHEYEGAIGPGEQVKLEEIFSFEEGRFKAEAYIDWDNSIKELEEMNNFKQSSMLTVAGMPSEQNVSDNGTSGPEEINVTLGENKCVDSDDGIKYYEKGRCVDDGPFVLGMDDYCKTKFTLIELYCTNSTKRCRFAEPYECYCKNGACV